MTHEEKDILLKDLCARLPYGVKMLNTEPYSDSYNPILTLSYISEDNAIGCRVDKGFMTTSLVSIKPYLFPLSSMTDEQKKEYNRLKHEIPVCYYEYGDVVEEIELYDSPESFEYLIENHFDYRGLIEKGLAIDCTNLNVY